MQVPSAAESNKVSFYTAALNEDLDALVASVQFGLKYTPHIKVKLNNNLSLAIAILLRIHQTMATSVYADTHYYVCRVRWCAVANTNSNALARCSSGRLMPTALGSPRMLSSF
jgi:hypothetical protein